MTQDDVITVICQFRKIYNWWDFDDFVTNVFNENSSTLSSGRNEYLQKKWKLYKHEPLLFYFTLDDTNKTSFIENMMTCSDGPGITKS